MLLEVGMMKIREITPKDSGNLAQLISEVEMTSDSMLFEAGERKISEEQFRKRIESFGQDASTILVAELQGKLVGYLIVVAGNANRTKHAAYLVIGVSAEHRGQGIGSQLFKKLDTWAKDHQLHRLELTVMESNSAGIALYQKNGFEIEGIKKDSLFVNGQYKNEYYMAKLIG